MDEQAQSRWFGWFTQVFLFSVVVWIIATAILGIPDGVGHSIESMKWIEVASSVAFPVWLGSFAGMLSMLAVAAFRALQRTRRISD
jgi:hypothetical protein